jgi:predicted ribosomally synthesized peptide with nif11-like leader
MSEARAKEFVQALANQPDLRTRLFNAQTPQERQQIIQQAGYGDVDPQEVKKLMQPGAGSELSDEQLATIAGGWFDNIKVSWW